MSTITLKYPVQDGAATFNEVSLRRPKVRDIAAGERARSKDGEMGFTIAMLSAMSGLDAKIIEELDIADFMKVAEAMTEMIGNDRPLQVGGA